MLLSSPFSGLLATISTIISWTPEEIALLSEKLTVQRFTARQYIFKKGDILSRIYFINSGLCRAVVDQENGERTLHLAGAGDFMTNIDGLFLKNPSHYSLQALTDIEAIFIDDEAMHCLRYHVKQGEKFLRIIYGQYCYFLVSNIMSRLKPNPMQRYDELLAKFPDIEQMVSQKIIASYLNITPEYLSILKSKRMQHQPMLKSDA